MTGSDTTSRAAAGQPPASHATLVLAESFPAAPESVFAALYEVMHRRQTRVSPGQATVVVEAADFRVGGSERLRIDAPATGPLSAVRSYHEIAPGARIVATDVMSAGGTTVAVAMTTIELEGHAAHSRLKVTIQLTALDDSDRGDAPRLVFEAVLEELRDRLGAPKRTRRR